MLFLTIKAQFCTVKHVFIAYCGTLAAFAAVLRAYPARFSCICLYYQRTLASKASTAGSSQTALTSIYQHCWHYILCSLLLFIVICNTRPAHYFSLF